MVNIDFNLLKIFYAVAKENNITKASQTLFISQPAVSQSIKKLEDELGGKLLYRSNKGISLTEEGKIFYKYIENSIGLIEKGVDSFKNFKNLESGVVNIGISTILTKIILMDVLKNFCTSFPKIKINIINDASPRLLEGLKNGLYDFVVINKADSQTGYKEKLIKEVGLCLVYNPEFFDYPNMRLKDIDTLPLILQSKASNTRKLFEEFLRENDIAVEPHYEVASQELVKFMALQGLGVGLVFDENLDSHLKKICLDQELPKNQVVFLENNDNVQSFASQKFKDFLLNSNL